MANTKGNVYPAIIISNDLQVFGINSTGAKTSLSKSNFAMDIGISEDGTLWVISTDPDPDGGGAKLYWSNGDGNWNEINTPDPGGFLISGGPNDGCYYVSGDGLYTMNTQGSGQNVDNKSYYSMDVGGGYIWAVYEEEDGEMPALYFAPLSNSLQWTQFKLNEGQNAPLSISASYTGDCYAVLDNDPVYLSKDGETQASAGAGANGKAIQMTFKNWNYLLTLDANQDGNLVMEWQDDRGGTYMNTNFRAYKVLSSYYRKS